jgi:hypothetical protein
MKRKRSLGLMVQSRSKYEMFKESSLSQQLAHKDKIYQQLAGADPQTSMTIGILNILGEFGIINLDAPTWKLTLALLNVKRKALFATSERTNEITKMGMQMPQGEDVYDGAADAPRTD